MVTLISKWGRKGRGSKDAGNEGKRKEGRIDAKGERALPNESSIL